MKSVSFFYEYKIRPISGIKHFVVGTIASLQVVTVTLPYNTTNQWLIIFLLLHAPKCLIPYLFICYQTLTHAPVEEEWCIIVGQTLYLVNMMT